MNLSFLGILKVFLALAGAALYAAAYVFLNFYLAKKFIDNFNKIRQEYRRVTANLTKSLQFPLLIFYGLALLIIVWWSTSELFDSRSLLGSAAYLLVIGFMPVLVIGWILWRSEQIRKWWDWRINQIAVVFFLGIGTWLAKTETASILNSVYPVDPSNLPNAMVAGTFLVTVGIFSLVVLIGTVVIQVVSYTVFVNSTAEKSRVLINIAYGLNALLFFCLAFLSAHALQIVGLSPFGRVLIIRVAYDYDFIDKHSCYQNRKDEKVLFIGSNQDKILIARATPFNQERPHRIQRDEMSKWYPTDFHLAPCAGTTRIPS